MNIEEFVSNFNDIIPYSFEVKIGGRWANHIKNDKNFISDDNRKGRVYSYYSKHLLEGGVKYIPIQEMNLPIDLVVDCSYPHHLLWEKRPDMTNKSSTSFEVRLLKNSEDKQFGFISIDLNASGDLEHKFCTYYNEGKNHEIIQSIFYRYREEDKKVIATETLSYIFNDIEKKVQEKVEFHKEDGILKGITIDRKPLNSFVSIVWSRDDVAEKNYMFSRYCNNPNNGRYSVCDNSNSIINNDFFEYEREYKDLMRDIECLDSDREFYLDVIKRRLYGIRYLANLKNDVFGGFVGSYFGNTVIKTDDGVLLLIETVEDDYHYFTSIDITNTDVFNVDMYLEREELDGSYYEVMKNSLKKPSFKVKLEGVEEVLVPIGEEITDEEVNAFNNYKTQYTQSFPYIMEKKLATLSLKRCGKKEEKASTLVKKYKDNKSKKKI